jgi:O-antigen/teichoic acid export membrane protein
MKMNLFHRMTINTSVQVAVKAVLIAISLGLTSVLTRALGPEKYGVYVFAITFLSFFSVLSDFGTSLVIVREAAGDRKKNSSIIATFWYVRLFLTMLAFILPIIAVFLFPYSAVIRICVVVGSGSIALSNFAGFPNALFQIENRIDIVSYLDLLGKLVTLGATLLFLFYHLDVAWFIGAIGIGNAVSLIAGLVISKASITEYQTARPSGHDMGKLLQSSMMVGITSLLAIMYFKLDTFMLSIFRSSAEIGYYGLAYKVFENILMLWGFYMASAYPALSAAYGRDKKMFADVRTVSLKIAIIAGLGLVVILYLLSPVILEILGGSTFHQSFPALRILILAVPLLCLNNFGYHILIIRKQEQKIMYLFLGSLAFNAIMNLFMIPRYGFIGASITTLATEVVNTIMYYGVYTIWKDVS